MSAHLASHRNSPAYHRRRQAGSHFFRANHFFDGVDEHEIPHVLHPVNRMGGEYLVTMISDTYAHAMHSEEQLNDFAYHLTEVIERHADMDF